MRHVLLAILLFTLTACDPFKPEVARTSIITINTDNAPHTFDPRQVRELETTTFIHNLYEGLMRSEGNANPAFALAESVEISPDQKTYTFKLRSSGWSNGEPVTSHDFKETWLSMLSPDFPAPNAYQLFIIKGAQAAKEGLGSKEEVAIQTPDDHTLIVELNNPIPYFLQLTATYFFYPVSRSMRTGFKDVVTNGPFELDPTSKSHNEWTLIPNPHYWDHEKLKIEKVVIMPLDTSTALNLFDRTELSWTGSPLSIIPVDALPDLKDKNRLEIHPAAGVYFLRVNTEKTALNNPKMRLALALALNRSDLVEHILQGNQQPALKYVPPLFLEGNPTFKDHDQEKARALFAEVLAEQKTLPSILINYSNGNDMAHKIAQVLQQQWKEGLGLDVRLQSLESKIFFDRLKTQDYQISIGAWFADLADPISFLEVFKQKNNGTNNTQWENGDYVALLDLSCKTADEQERKRCLQRAETILMEEMPIIPLFYSTYNNLRDPKLKGVHFSELGYLDFKHAYFE